MTRARAVASIAGVTLHRVRLPLRAPHAGAHGREETRELVLVSISDSDGAVGWGECPTLARAGYTAEWTDGAWASLAGEITPGLIGRAADSTVDDRPREPMATGAVRDALLDLALRRSGRSLAAHIGSTSPAVAFGAAIGLAADVEALVATVDQRLARGAIHATLKVTPDRYRAAVAAVRAAHSDLSLAVDANGSFTSADDPDLATTDELGLTHIEQPLRPTDIAGLVTLSGRLQTPVALDESATSPEAVSSAIARGTGRALTVKASRLGGIEAALSAARAARAAGWGVLVGGMLESGVGRAAAVALAATDLCTLPTVVGPSSALFADDVVEPVEPDSDGRLAVHCGHGIAPAPDPDRLAALRVDRLDIIASPGT